MSYFANFLTFRITGIGNCLDLLKNSENRSYVKGAQSRLIRSGLSGSILEHPSGRNKDNLKEETDNLCLYFREGAIRPSWSCSGPTQMLWSVWAVRYLRLGRVDLGPTSTPATSLKIWNQVGRPKDFWLGFRGKELCHRTPSWSSVRKRFQQEPKFCFSIRPTWSFSALMTSL